MVSGQWTPTVLAGGTGVEMDPMHYWKCFDIVFISCATWKFVVQGPTEAALALSLPFPVKSIRSFGMMGYNNTGRNIIPACMKNTGIGFVIKSQDGSTTDVKGTDSFGGQTFQFSLIYATGKE